MRMICGTLRTDAPAKTAYPCISNARLMQQVLSSIYILKQTATPVLEAQWDTGKERMAHHRSCQLL